MQAPEAKSPLEGNLRRFILFRVFFNARFYYPVFTILYLDYGLTLEQFALLNMVWALTIVLAEVPSGALADIIGRKRLLVTAAILMFIEMALLVLVPSGASALLFSVFLINRVCSGLAEAAASGADEALAYDSLKALGREDEWAHLLEKTTRYLSIAFFTTMILGALSFDQAFVNAVLDRLESGLSIPPDLALRMPVILTWMTSLIVLYAALTMRETHSPAASDAEERKSLRTQLTKPFRQILAALRWTLDHRFVLFVIFAALALDSVARQFVVLASEYYRLIEIPTAWFGFIGAGIALFGILTARLSRYLVTHRSPMFNFSFLSLVLLVSLAGISFTLPWAGVLFAVGAFSMMSMVQYQSSYYINREVESQRRATLLSFRGLALNLGLGMASLLYTGWIAVLKARERGTLSGRELQESVFVKALPAFPLYALLLIAGVLILGRIYIRRRHLCFTIPESDRPGP